MKKLFICGAFAFFTVMNAQSTKFGLKAGYSLSNISEEYEGTTHSGDSKSSFYVGALIEVKLNPKWALQGELLFSKLGAKDEIDLESINVNQEDIYIGPVEQKVDFSSIIIPLGAKYYFTNKFSANAGLSFVFYVNRNIEYNLADYNKTANDRANKYFKTFNFGPYLGLEYQLTEHFFMDTRYTLGLANISHLSIDEYTMKNSFFQLGVGYKF